VEGGGVIIGHASRWRGIDVGLAGRVQVVAAVWIDQGTREGVGPKTRKPWRA
jgi:hypothetical protein